MPEHKEYLHFEHAGKDYVVNAKGEITSQHQFNQLGDKAFSGNWLLLGVNYHHWRNGIDVRFPELWAAPERMKTGMVWDKDHGTTRQWSGQYFGKLPRVTRAYKIPLYAKENA